jgi:hypothetical protein
MQWVIEIGLMGLLIATLVHLVRLSRALALLKRDRGPLEDLMSAFAHNTREAQAGIEQLRQTADGAGKRITQQIETAQALRDDLIYMIERAERLADRLDGAVRNSRPLETNARPAPPPLPVREPEPAPQKVRSQAERDLLQALRLNK